MRWPLVLWMHHVGPLVLWFCQKLYSSPEWWKRLRFMKKQLVNVILKWSSVYLCVSPCANCQLQERHHILRVVVSASGVVSSETS
jgi:hypothetical protein